MEMLSDTNPTGESEIEKSKQTDWVSVLALLAHNKQSILKWTALFTIFGVIVALLIPAKFTSSAKILPPERVASTASLFSESGVAALALGGGGASLLRDPNDQYIGLIRSRIVADRIIQKFNLQKVYSTSDMAAARRKLDSETAVTAGRDNLIVITVVDHDRQLAADIANAYVDGLRDLTADFAITSAARRRVFFEQQLQASMQQLSDAEMRLRGVQEQTGVVAAESQAKTTIDVAGALREKIAAKQVEVNALQSFATENNPQLQIAKTELASLRAQLSQVDHTNAAGDPLNISIRGLPKSQQELVDATREEKYQEAVYAMLGKQLEAARLDEAHEAPIVQVVEAAIPADRKTSPRRSMIVAAFLMAGLFLSSFVIFTRFLVEHASPSRRQTFSNLKKALSSW